MQLLLFRIGSNVLWSMVSKAFEKSKYMPIPFSPVSRDSIDLFIKIIRAIWDECHFLNPNCSLTKTFDPQENPVSC